MAKRRRPEEKFSIIRGAGAVSDRNSKGLIDKRATTLSVVSAEEKEASTGGLISSSLFVPSDEQLEKINQFTLRRVSADEVACFTTHSCNDLIDRDDDRFNTKAVKGFAALEPPYSPTGKSYMVAHDTSKLAVGRIFDTGTKGFKVDDEPHTMLTNDVYIPRITANDTFIQNLEFGVNWAVSVGVMLGKGTCFIGKEHEWGWMPWWCSEGHEKGYFYDPESDEEDSWGWPMPVSESAKGAVKCFRDLDDAKDMYELSQVYLGAQYMAQVQDKNPEFAGIIKSAGHAPLVGLRREEAKMFFIPALPEKAREAAKAHAIKENDGVFQWVDESDLVWSFTPGEDSEPLLLGKKSEGAMSRSELNSRVQDLKSKQTEAKGEIAKLTEANTTDKDIAGAGALASQLDGLLTEIDSALDDGDTDTANPLVDQAQDVMDQLFDALYENEDDTDADDPNQDPEDKGAGNPENKGHSHYHQHSDGTGHSHMHNHASADNYDHNADDTDVAHDHGHDNKNPQGDAMSKKAVKAAVAKVTLPGSLVKLVDEAGDEAGAALDALLKGVSEELTKSGEMAKAGEAYVKDLRADALDWYRKAHQNPNDAKGLDVSHIERILDSVGNNTDVIKSLIADYKSSAEARFGKAVRRSSVESDANNPSGEEANEIKGDIETRIDGKRVTRIHG